MRLQPLQRLFRDVVAEGARRVEDLPICEPPPGSTRADRLGIYSYAYWVRQEDALLEDFPSVVEGLGDGAARELARRYLTAYPSRHASLSELGRDFAVYLAGEAETARLAPEAELDWLEVCAERAPELPDTDRVADLGAMLAALGEEGMLTARLKLNPSVKLSKSQRTLIHRYRAEIFREELSASQLRLLEAIQAGAQVLALLELLTPEEAEPQLLMGWFSEWARNGVIVGVVGAPAEGNA